MILLGILLVLSFIAVEIVLLAVMQPRTVFGATVEIPVFLEEQGMGYFPISSKFFEYPANQSIVEIPYKDVNINIDVEEYMHCVNHEEQLLAEQLKDTNSPGATLLNEKSRLDVLAACVILAEPPGKLEQQSHN